MSVKLAYNRYEQFANTSGVPYAGAKLFTYVGGSVNTKQTTYTESTGSTPNTNPIVLDSAGQLPQPVWLTTGLSYKFVLAPSTDTDPPVSPIWTLDGITGINDSSASQSEWIAGPTPTFVSASSFTLVGDQTANFAKSRRIKATVTAGTVYGTIVNSAFAASTTVTVALDSGNLDSGLSAISYGIIAAANPSIDADLIARKATAVASATTTDIWSIAGDFVHITGTVTITSLGTAPYAGTERTLIFDGALTLTHNATTLQLPGVANIVTAAGDRARVRADTTANMIVTDYVKASSIAATLAGTETLTNKTLTTPTITNPSIDTVTGAVVATQANMESASATNLVVSPGRQQFHPSAAKAWVSCDNTGTKIASYNVTSVSDVGTGRAQANLTVSFSSAAYAAVCCTDGGGGGIFGGAVALATGSFELRSWNTATQTLSDSGQNYGVAFGDQ